jgi:hypothetical protein
MVINCLEDPVYQDSKKIQGPFRILEMAPFSDFQGLIS